MNSVKTRFAPSPTGYLHIGGVRTALYSYLYAKKHSGEFLLRIEDTDAERNVEEATQFIIAALNWLGLKADHPPVFQSQRIEIYQTYLHQLLEKKDAYVCNCSKERLESMREKAIAAKQQPKYDGHCRDQNHPFEHNSAVRLKVKQTGTTEFLDATHGKLAIPNSQLDDLVIFRKGMPTYNFSVVIDDALMGISHIIRGDDHINNTFRQIPIFEKCGFQLPIFSHLPMILAEDGSRLSKRNQASNVMDYQSQGFLPEALVNYLFRLGYSYGDEEIFSLAKMIEVFELEKINKSPASLNLEKLAWLNQQYLQKTDNVRLLEILGQNHQLNWPTSNSSPDENQRTQMLACIEMQKTRAKTIKELASYLAIFLEDHELAYEEKFTQQYSKNISMDSMLAFIQALKRLQSFKHEAIHEVLAEVVQKFYEGQFGKFARGVRYILTSSVPSGDLALVMELMGQQRALNRLESFVKKYL